MVSDRSSGDVLVGDLFLFSLQVGRLFIGCGVGVTFIFGICLVLLASVVSGKSRKKNFWGYRKNICARILNGFVSETNDRHERATGLVSSSSSY